MYFWSEIIPVISNLTATGHSFDLDATHMISDHIVLPPVQLPLLIIYVLMVFIIYIIFIFSVFINKGLLIKNESELF